MQETSGQEVHVHAPPQGFWRKYVFSLDHKVIGKQYYALALVAVFTGMVLSWVMRIHMVWPEAKIPGLDLALQDWSAGRRNDAGILSLAAHDARHVDGFLCSHQCAFRRVRKLFSCRFRLAPKTWLFRGST